MRRAVRSVEEEAGGQGLEDAGGEVKREVRRTRHSALKGIFEKVQVTFENWRMDGQYVDREDLIVEFARCALEKKTELQAKKTAQMALHSTDQAILTAIEKRFKAHTSLRNH